jgi:HemY protein
VSEIWQQAPSRDRQTDALLTPYIDGLMKQGQGELAADLIETFVSKQWNEHFVKQYGLIKPQAPLKRLAKAEGWLVQHQDNPVLLLTVGRLAAANQFWIKAEEYLRSSLDFAPQGETYLALAEVLAAHDKQDEAAEFYKKGLNFVLQSH